MIFDSIENAKLYYGLHEGIAKVLGQVKDYTADNYPDGRVEIDGDNVFLNTTPYTTVVKESPTFEAHRKYIDVMYMVEGEEIIYVNPTSKLSDITQEYCEEKDVLLAGPEADAIPVRIKSGQFVILFPQDAHAPSCAADNTPMLVKKIIGKVKI